jgi:8-oxo-dGTP pyrophosphatase MutT (NUDIX family)
MVDDEGSDALRRLGAREGLVGADSPPAVPAATVILLRDDPDPDQTLEVLLVRRNADLVFAGGMWVFPGGRVDAGDRRPEDDSEGLAAARRAGAREVAEEAGLTVDPDTLVMFSHWTPPPGTRKRFATWFFVAAAPVGAVTVDGGEIHAFQWCGPRRMLQRHRDAEVELAPPTWITLAQILEYPDTASVLRAAGAREPGVFVTRIVSGDDGAVALYDGDAGYADGDARRAGGRHRLNMTKSGWSYQPPDGTIVTP